MSNWETDEAATRNVSVSLLLDQAWQAAFAQCKSTHVVPKGDPRQRFGIDREMLLKDGSLVPVEDKVRFRPYSDDILLEVEHVFDDGRTAEPGWIRKPLKCQYIGFLWVPDRRFEVYPWLQLQSWYAVEMRKKGFRNNYARVATRNNNHGYKTVSIVVPRSALIGDMSGLMRAVVWNDDTAEIEKLRS